MQRRNTENEMSECESEQTKESNKLGVNESVSQRIKPIDQSINHSLPDSLND